MQKPILAILIFGASSAGAQTVHTGTAHPAAHKTQAHKAPTPAPPFWVSTYQEALAKATEVRGLVFVRQGTADCTTCSVGGDKILKEKGVLDSLRLYCAAGVYLAPSDTDASVLHRAAFGFVTEDGTPVFRFEGRGAPTRTAYLDGLREAADRRTGMQPLRLLEAERLLGDKDENNLEAIIAERNREGLPADSLLEIYVEGLSEDSLGSPRVVRFLALQAPILNSEANQLLRQDAALFNAVWQGLTIKERIRINNDVISKTRAQAVANGDQEEVLLAATFAANTNTGPTAKVRAFQGVMLDFYYGMADTDKFLNLASTYYDRFLMPFAADSLRRQDSLNHREEDLSVSRFVGMQLESGASKVLLLTSDNVLLRQAGAWADKAVALYPSREALDTQTRFRARLAARP